MSGRLLITLGRPQYIVMLVGIFAVLLVCVVLFVSPYLLEGLYLRYAWGPTLEREFGFRIEERAIFRRGTTEQYLVIATTTPGGLLARSGIAPGDVPLNCHHGCTFGFYSALMAARQEAGVRLRVLSQDDLAQERGAVREVSIVSPSQRTTR
jgi:hypothetical protein